MRVLEERLDQLWIITFKLMVNISQFNKEKQVAKENINKGVTNANIDQKTGRQTSRNVIPSVRYAGVVANRVWKPKDTRGVGKKEVAKWTSIEHTMEEEELQWLKNCYVGKVHSLDDILTLQDIFILAGCCH